MTLNELRDLCDKYCEEIDRLCHIYDPEEYRVLRAMAEYCMEKCWPVAHNHGEDYEMLEKHLHRIKQEHKEKAEECYRRFVSYGMEREPDDVK